MKYDEYNLNKNKNVTNTNLSKYKKEDKILKMQ